MIYIADKIFLSKKDNSHLGLPLQTRTCQATKYPPFSSPPDLHVLIDLWISGAMYTRVPRHISSVLDKMDWVCALKIYSVQNHILCTQVGLSVRIITPPARRAWRSYKFASLDFSGFFFGVRSNCQKLGCRSWVIPLAPSCMSPSKHGV